MEERTQEIAIEYLEHYKNVKYGMMPEWVWDMAIKALEQEPKTGHWKLSEDKEHGKCSECGAGYFDLVGGQIYAFCPTCGAKMVEPQESEEVGSLSYMDGTFIISAEEMVESEEV